MAKIPLTIDKHYCDTWGVFHGIREILQNAKDAEDYEGKPMALTHYPRTNRLEIITRGAYVEPARLLVLGQSSKGDGRQRGKFGEGFVLGVLALVRRGCDVRFRNGDMSWTVAFEMPDVGHPLEGSELLTFKSRALAHREPDFCIEIDGINTEAWDLIRAKFLFLTPPKAADTLTTASGTLLLDRVYKGSVYVRGIFVRTFEDLACGYDLQDVELDRDRQMINEFDLHYTLGRLWQQAAALSPEAVAPRVYALAAEGGNDARLLHHHADAALLKSVRTTFEQTYGEDAVPVVHNYEAEDVVRAGGSPTMVSRVLQDLLSKGGLSVATAKAALAGTVTRRWLPTEVKDELGPEASANMCWLGNLLPAMTVVTFPGDRPTCQLIDNNTVVGVDHRLLAQPLRELLAAAIGPEAQRRGVMPIDVLLDYVAAVPVSCGDEAAPATAG